MALRASEIVTIVEELEEIKDKLRPVMNVQTLQTFISDLEGAAGRVSLEEVRLAVKLLRL